MSNALQEILNRATQRLMWFDQQPKAVREANAESERTLTNIIEIAQAAVGPVSPVRDPTLQVAMTCDACGKEKPCFVVRDWHLCLECFHEACHNTDICGCAKLEEGAPVRDPAPPRLAEIEARLRAATPGPWEWDTTCDDDHIIRMATAIKRPANHECQDSIVYDHGLHPEDGVQYERAQANAELIAHAPDDIRYLLELVRGVRDPSPPEPSAGTMECPVCGVASPHYHDPQKVNEARVRLATEMSFAEIAQAIVTSAFRSHGDSFYISGHLVDKLKELLAGVRGSGVVPPEEPK